MLRIGPSLLNSSRRRTSSLSSLIQSNLQVFPCLKSTILSRKAPTCVCERFLSSNKLPDEDYDGSGDVDAKPRSKMFSSALPGNMSNRGDEKDEYEYYRKDGARGTYPSERNQAQRQNNSVQRNDNQRNQRRWKNADPDRRQVSYGRGNNASGNSPKTGNLSRNNKTNKSQAQQRSRPGNGQGPHDANARLRDLMNSLKQTANQPSTSSTTSKPDPIPSIPRLRQRFGGQEETNSPSSLPPKHPREFLIRPSTSEASNSEDAESKSTGRQVFPGYRMPQRQRSQSVSKDPNNRNSGGPSRPRIRNDMDFLEGRKAAAEEIQSSESQPSELPIEDTRVVTLPAGKMGLDLTQTSALFRIKIEEIQKKLKAIGIFPEDLSNKATRLDLDTLELLAIEFGIETVRGEEDVVADSEELLIKQRRADDTVTFPPRPPVVCIMGHVDHGKTTLMDALRRRSQAQQDPKAKKGKAKQKKKSGDTSLDDSNVAGTEAGGITQVISAFQVEVEDNKVTFLDTPGHAAFKSMRQSGSHAADVIVLVVAADDGVSEQTIEILDFYKSIVKGSSGGISMVVALNKIDKPGIDVEEAQMRIENQLLEQGILCEGMKGDSEYGPPVQVIPTSGLSGLGLDDLIDGLVLQSEVMDLRANDAAHAEGIVMDARMEKGLGVVADCIVRWGSIKKGDCIVSGTQASRVRMLKDVNDKVLKYGLPSQPVRIVGFKSLPKAGDPVLCVDSEEVAEEMVEQRLEMDGGDQVERAMNTDDVEIHISGMRSRDLKRAGKIHQLAGLQDGDGTVRIPIVVKAGADGSLSAVRDSLVNLGVNSHHKVIVDPIQEGIGEITPTDVQMAKESEACIFAFGLSRIDQAIINLAESEGVVIRRNDIIYSLLDDAKVTLGKYLPPEQHEQVHGRASVQAIFTVTTEGTAEKVAGLKVLDGHLYKEKDPDNLRTHFRVIRDGAQISPKGQAVQASSLRKFKELVDNVRHGEECGLGLSGFDEFEEGDEIECFSVEMRAATL